MTPLDPTPPHRRGPISTKTFELGEAAPHVTELVVCDDADSSFAFLDHCTSRT